MADIIQRTRITKQIVTSQILNDEGVIEGLKLSFSEHHYIAVIERNHNVSVTLGYTHHGIELNTTINGEFEKAINLLRKQFPDGIRD